MHSNGPVKFPGTVHYFPHLRSTQAQTIQDVIIFTHLKQKTRRKPGITQMAYSSRLKCFIIFCMYTVRIPAPESHLWEGSWQFQRQTSCKPVNEKKSQNQTAFFASVFSGIIYLNKIRNEA